MWEVLENAAQHGFKAGTLEAINGFCAHDQFLFQYAEG